jgi:exosortase
VLSKLGVQRWAPSAVVGAIGLACLLLLWPVFQHAWSVWLDNEDLRFGFFLLPTAGWLAWRSREDLRHSPGRGGRHAGLVLLFLSVVAYLVFERIAARTPAALAAGLVLWAAVCCLWGARSALVLAYPLALVTYGLALQQTLIAPLAFWLQGLTAVMAANISNQVGLHVVRDGLMLRGETFAFVIAEACSGMNSLLALVGLAAVWVYLVRGHVASRAATFVAVVPVAILANTVRVVLVLLIAHAFGEDVATGFFHGASGLALFSMALLGLWSISRVTGCRAPLAA